MTRVCFAHTALVCLAAGTNIASATPFGFGFFYQGQLRPNGMPVNGNVTLTFTLWDAPGTGSPPSGGHQISGKQTVTVPVESGLFSVELNAHLELTTDLFDGEARWLQIEVEGTPLSPRQALDPAPFAYWAREASSLAPDSNESIVIQAEDGQLNHPAGGAIHLLAGDGETTAEGALGGEVLIQGGVGGFSNSLIHKGGTVTIQGGLGGTAFATGGPGGDILLRPGLGGPAQLPANPKGQPGVVAVETILGVGTLTPSPNATLTLVPNATSTAILIRPATLTGGNSVGITFVDPDGGTGPMTLKYADTGAASLEIVGGPLRAPAFVQTSSARFKQNITDLPSGLLDKLLRLKPVAFKWDAEHGGAQDVGLIAEEVEKVLPEVVYKVAGRAEGINYAGLTAIAIQALREQVGHQQERDSRSTSQVQELETRLHRVETENAELRQRLDRLEKSMAQTTP